MLRTIKCRAKDATAGDGFNVVHTALHRRELHPVTGPSSCDGAHGTSDSVEEKFSICTAWQGLGAASILANHTPLKILSVCTTSQGSRT